MSGAMEKMVASMLGLTPEQMQEMMNSTLNMGRMLNVRLSNIEIALGIHYDENGHVTMPAKSILIEGTENEQRPVADASADIAASDCGDG